MEQILQWDRDLFNFLNHCCYSGPADTIMEFVSKMTVWIPLYAVLLTLIILWFKKQSWVPILAIALTVASADLISTRVFKRGIERHRPCHENVDLGLPVRQIEGAGCGTYGFVSSHATNHFAIAVFVGLLFYRRSKWWLYGGLIWAGIIAYSRIYLGVHYPLDVIGGAILGVLLAVFWIRMSNLILKKINKQ